MDYKKSAADILTYIGGEKNVVNLEHCSTRLRFTVADQTLVDEANLKKVPGVIGVILNVQVQIVIGNAVILERQLVTYLTVNARLASL